MHQNILDIFSKICETFSLQCHLDTSLFLESISTYLAVPLFFCVLCDQFRNGRHYEKIVIGRKAFFCVLSRWEIKEVAPSCMTVTKYWLRIYKHASKRGYRFILGKAFFHSSDKKVRSSIPFFYPLLNGIRDFRAQSVGLVRLDSRNFLLCFNSDLAKKSRDFRFGKWRILQLDFSSRWLCILLLKVHDFCETRAEDRMGKSWGWPNL